MIAVKKYEAIREVITFILECYLTEYKEVIRETQNYSSSVVLINGYLLSVFFIWVIFFTSS